MFERFSASAEYPNDPFSLTVLRLYEARYQAMHSWDVVYARIMTCHCQGLNL